MMLRAINIFIRTCHELWLRDENVVPEVMIEDLTYRCEMYGTIFNPRYVLLAFPIEAASLLPVTKTWVKSAVTIVIITGLDCPDQQFTQGIRLERLHSLDYAQI
ncbi:uncharacterized protein LOC110840947 [Zootermopsis nevadensis]|uniref:Uncharacterized protein n=1 Tax=Zootermopsis nevadensis TaxID=136037 RepID=A0A067QRW0_ZOONE|nr:uncharacterized protein LOC110840947 [Zootermopsis nevadensis]KDQ71615.1 hypothetical protein L798_07426 [Zootermopsis nevadensis]